MPTLIITYLFLLGLALGSFYNVVALRVPAGQSVIHPPSRCGSCGTRLRTRDLIPVFSWLLAKGRCRHCGVPVSWLYPLGEAATGLLFVWTYLRFGLSGEGMLGLLLASLAVIVTISDLHSMLVPNKVLLAFLPLLAAMTFSVTDQPWWSHVLGVVAGGGILLVLVLLGGMGMGDAKLFALFGGVIGFPGVILAFLAACLLGTLIGGGLRLAGSIGRRQPIPFAPCLAAGTLLTWGYGSQIISGYLSLIG
ncbi:peptidase A24A domain-containing protein [Paenibacillus algicola]|uniref:Peptidase A24A domain-containing protein n=1 Tax=Paenibacillus algicola TaxID=2565926 RepID=A0A4P8XRR0_9BACL|nr:A24 family peptidase [Paenibacillus algicola]QCT04531.1 peptidase A24A domain-containing protein [Paenibacillus algicola]